ncbi:MAG: glycoside hydrolase family 36 protein [Candidatus Omnitrophota bacterium]
MNEKLKFTTKNFSLNFNLQRGQWNISSNRPGFSLKKIKTKVYLNNQWLTLFKKTPKNIIKEISQKDGGLIIEEKRKDFTVRLRLYFPEKLPAVFLETEIKNNSQKNITLGSLHLIEVEKGIGLGKKTDSPKIFVDSGGGWWAGVVDAESSAPFKEQWELMPEEDKCLTRELKGQAVDRGFHNSSGGISALYNPKNKATLIVSFLTFNRTANNVTWLYREKNNSLCGWAGCDFAGFRLQPGESISSEKLFLGFYSSPFAGLEEYAGEAAKMMQVKLPATPPMGWCSWYAYRFKITEKITLANAKLIKKRFPEYDFSYIQIDHGWQHQNTCGNWTKTNERFPHGIKWLAGKLNKTGFKLGLWLGVFTVLESSTLFKEHPEYLIKDREGNPKPMPYRWSWPPQDRVFYLDPTHPGAREFLRNTFTYLRKAGVRYWKIDFTWGIALSEPDAVFYDKTMVKGAEIYRKGLSLVREVLKNDYLYWCSNPINLGFGLGATSMSGSDIGNPGFRLAQKVEGRIEDLDFFRLNATQIISRYFLHKKLILLNPDVVEVGKPGDFEEAKIRLSLVAFAGGQVFLGDDLTSLSDKEWNLLSRCIPPLGTAARPVDLFEHTYPSSYPHIWHLPVKTAWGKWDLVALFNLSKEETEMEIVFSSLNLEDKKEYLVFEFWEKIFLGKKNNSIKMKLKPVTTKLLMIKEVSVHPVVLSTDMHFSQGGVELEKVAYNDKTNALEGIAKRQKGEKGNLFIYVPEGYRAEETGHGTMRQNNIITLLLNFKKSTVKWRLKFHGR